MFLFSFIKIIIYEITVVGEDKKALANRFQKRGQETAERLLQFQSFQIVKAFTTFPVFEKCEEVRANEEFWQVPRTN